MSLDYYAGLLRSGSRIEPFRRAITAAVRGGDRVLEIGTGLGTFAFFAARAGAERVWAVDSSPILHTARAVARVNGLEERIDFVRGRVPDVALPAPFDVVIYEDFPSRLLDEDTFRLLTEVAGTLLAPGGRTVPLAARLHLAPLASPFLRERLFPVENGEAGGLFDFDWGPTLPYLGNQPRHLHLPADALAAEAAAGPRLPLLPPPVAGDLTVEGRWTLPEGARIDALAFWFDLEVGQGEWITNAPGSQTQPWGQVTLPLDPPVLVGPGGELEAWVRREAFTDGAPGWLTWQAESGGSEARGHEFAAYPAALEDLFPEADS